MSNFLLDFLSLGAILSGILVITSKNPVISVLFLISVFVNVAGYLVLLGVGFIGISYLIVYVGAIAILFLFVVMMLNLQLAELSAVGSEYTQNLPLGAILGSLFLFELVSILPFSFKNAGSLDLAYVFNVFSELSLGTINWFNTQFVAELGGNNDVHQTFNTSVADTNFDNYLQIQSIGQSLYTYGSVWLLLTSLILLLAIIGPITLSINRAETASVTTTPFPVKNTGKRHYSTKRSSAPEKYYLRQRKMKNMLLNETSPTVNNITEILNLPAGTVTKEIMALCKTIYLNGNTYDMPYRGTNAAKEFNSTGGPHTTKSNDVKLAGCYHIYDSSCSLSGYVGQSIHLGRRVRDHANGHHIATTDFVALNKSSMKVTIFILNDKEKLTGDIRLFITILEQYLFFVLRPTVNISLIANPGLVVPAGEFRVSSESMKALWKPLYLYKVSTIDMSYTLIYTLPNTDSLSTLANTSKS